MTHRGMLAKSSTNQETPKWGETLLGHSQAVMSSFKIMFRTKRNEPTRLGHQWLRFFKIKEDDFDIFFNNGLAACGLHDIGKANNGFQDMVNNRKGTQTIYHEHLSALILGLPVVNDWFKEIPGIDMQIIISAIIGHHLRASFESFAQPLNPDLKYLEIYPEGILGVINQWAVEIKGLQVCKVALPTLWSFVAGHGFEIGKLRDKLKKELRKFRQEIRGQETINRKLMAVRAALIVSDSSGSAIVRENKDLQDWLEKAFNGILDGGYIHDKVIAPRVQEIRKNRGVFEWGDFQIAAEGMGRRSLLLAPCGSGKTLAAWRWIKSRLNERPAARVIFLYPTRATATEGFRDYVSWAPDADAGLIHGTATYELTGMFNNPDDERSQKDFTTEDRLYALGFWQRRVFSATVDQFLGFMQQVYRSVCLMPLVADSVIVIDEVHSFDRSLFSALKIFLKNFDVPVLCMTASLPPSRRKELEECGLEIFPQDIKAFSDLEEHARMPRYLVQCLNDADQAEEIAIRALEHGKRVLWVVNKVDRCQSRARTLNALCYHSRFKLEHRKLRHNAAITAFREQHNPIIALTTQVCEMSLDLDADVLISEVAPITSLIQRMGRCNRRAVIKDGRLGEVYFYYPEDIKPYEPKDMIGVEKFLEILDGRTVSQMQLEELLETFGAAEIEVERFAAFIENGPWALAREESLRDANDFNVDAILTCDLTQFLEKRRERKPTYGLIVPVPRRFARTHPRLGRYPQVADASHYHPEYGFLDFPLEEII